MREVTTVRLLVPERSEGADGQIVVKMKMQQIRLPLRRQDREELLHRLQGDAT